MKRRISGNPLGMAALMLLLAIPLGALVLSRGQAIAQEVEIPAKIEVTPEGLKKGAEVYYRRCSFCHGLTGAGDGPVADYVDPRPRDFRLGKFKFRITESGELPTDEDLYRTVGRGVPGTAMPAWAIPNEILNPREIWQVVFYLKTLIDPEVGIDPNDSDYDPYQKIIPLGDIPDPGTSPDTVRKGFVQFVMNQCWTCHGIAGRGDGRESGTHDDDWGYKIPIADMQKPWRYKNGDTAADFRRTFVGGLNGTPMPSYSFLDELEPGSSWDLAYFVEAVSQAHDFDAIVKEGTVLEAEMKEGSGEASRAKSDISVQVTRVDTESGRLGIQTMDGQEGFIKIDDLQYRFTPKKPEQTDPTRVIIRSVRREDDLPTDPNDPAWDEAAPLDIRLSGQILLKPRLQTPTVDQITVRSFYNDKEVAFLLEWNDRFEDTKHESKNDYPDASTFKETYIRLWGEGGDRSKEGEALRDAVAIQMAVNLPEGPQKPHFYLGDRKGGPVHLMRWESDRGDQGGVIEMNASGFQKGPSPQPEDKQQAAGRGIYHNGRWKAVITRPMTTDDDKDTQIVPGAFHPISFLAWDGRNGEKGHVCSISSWYYLLPEVPIPSRVYLAALIAALAAAGVEFLLIRSRKQGHTPISDPLADEA